MKIVRKISVILIIISMSFAFWSTAFAEEQESLSDVINQANDWIDVGSTNGTIDTNEIADILKPIAQALRIIGMGVILCAGAFMGIKWVTAKPDEQAKLKQQSIGLLVAAIVIIGAYTIWSIALRIVGQL